MILPTSAVASVSPHSGYRTFTAEAHNPENHRKGAEMQIPPAPSLPALPETASLRAKSVELEAAFLSEMLASAGLDKALSPAQGDGAPDPFAYFLREQMARNLARKGSVGLSEAIFRSLIQAGGGSHDG